MPTVAFITPEEHEASITALRQEFFGLLSDYVTKRPQWLTTEEAAKEAAIARCTLIQFARASAPDTQEPGRITYRKDGRKSYYLLSSCIDYRRTKAGQPALAAA